MVNVDEAFSCIEFLFNSFNKCSYVGIGTRHSVYWFRRWQDFLTDVAIAFESIATMTSKGTPACRSAIGIRIAWIRYAFTSVNGRTPFSIAFKAAIAGATEVSRPGLTAGGMHVTGLGVTTVNFLTADAIAKVSFHTLAGIESGSIHGTRSMSIAWMRRAAINDGAHQSTTAVAQFTRARKGTRPCLLTIGIR